MKRASKKDREFNLLLSFNKYAFASLVVLSFGSLALEMVTYPGFLQNYTGITPSVFLGLTTVSLCIQLFQKIFMKQKMTEASNLVMRINAITLPFLLFIFFMFNGMERQKYLNYVFATFHFHLSVLETIVIFSTFLALLFALSLINLENLPLLSLVNAKKSQSFSSNLNKQLLGPLIFFVSILFLVVSQFSSIAKLALEDLNDIVRQPFASFESRRAQKFGRAYLTYQFIARHTEPESVIAVPPQFTWIIVGNVGFSRYFLYPRFLIHPEDYTPDTLPEIDYYIVGESTLIPEDNTYRIWPTAAIPVESVYTYDEYQEVEAKIDTTMYDPNDPVYRGKWAVLKVLPGTKVHSGPIQTTN